jgi:hypothetical protein
MRWKAELRPRTKFSALMGSIGGSDSELTRPEKQIEGKIIPRKEHESVVDANQAVLDKHDTCILLEQMINT